VLADERIRGRQISPGGGRPGLALAVSAAAAIEALHADVADVSKPEGPPSNP
jgi:hypothetical protein